MYQRPIVGYHGCDLSVVEDVLLKDTPMKPSLNDYDWLGNGIYFWENGPDRALAYAAAKQRREGGRSSIKKPAVLGAYLHLGRCFDLTDIWATKQLRTQYNLMAKQFSAAGLTLPENKSGFIKDSDFVLRFLDCAVIQETVDDHDEQFPDKKIQTVRGIFTEGGETYPGAGFHLKTHVQVAVRDTSCILGFFKPKIDPVTKMRK